jgi:pimeloyl-ACP methyl ester carboxylesterase
VKRILLWTGVVIAMGGCATMNQVRPEVMYGSRSYQPIVTTIDEMRVEYCYLPPTDPSGHVCLAIHGAAGGWDQAYDMAGIVPDGTGVLAVSRFGYLESDLPDDPSPSRQAEVYRALLDRLGIPSVVLLGGSAGSVAAVRFALLYPDRTSGVILLAGGSFASAGETTGGPPAFLINDFCFGLLRVLTPGFYRSMLGISRREWRKASEEARQAYRDQIKGMFPIKPRRAGILTDMEVTNNDPVINPEHYSVEEIKCPVLILHSATDPWNSPEQMARLASRIPNVDLVITPGGGHVMLGYEALLKEATATFFRELRDAHQ